MIVPAIYTCALSPTADAEEPDPSEEEQEQEDVKVRVDNNLDDTDEDFMTDDGEEHEVEHELRWKQSDAWKTEARTDP